MFLETLVDFIHVHKEDLQDWLFVLLTQLLKKMGADLLGSVQAKVQKALDVTRLVSHLSRMFLVFLKKRKRKRGMVHIRQLLKFFMTSISG